MHSVKIMALIQEWADAHQVSRDAIINQIYIAHVWADSNPKKAPRKYMTRYLDSWIKQAKRYGNLKSPEKPQNRPPEPESESDMTFEEMVAIRRRNMPQRATLAAQHKDAIDSEVLL